MGEGTVWLVLRPLADGYQLADVEAFFWSRGEAEKFASSQPGSGWSLWGVDAVRPDWTGGVLIDDEGTYRRGPASGEAR